MRPITVALLLLAVALAGCARNQIEIRNQSTVNVDFLFRGEQHAIASGAVETVTDIPNGMFAYATNYIPPSGTKNKTEIGPLSGNLVFEQSKTKVLMLYDGKKTTDTTYEFRATVSTSLNQSSLASTAP